MFWLIILATTGANSIPSNTIQDEVCKENIIPTIWSKAKLVDRKDWNVNPNTKSSNIDRSLPIIQSNNTLTYDAINTYLDLNDLAQDLGLWKMKTYMSKSNLLIKHYNTKVKTSTLLKLLQKSNAAKAYYNAIPRTNAYYASKLAPHIFKLTEDIFKSHPKIPPLLRCTLRSGVKWSAHYDGHQNHVLQILGVKVWLLFPPGVVLPELLFPSGHASERHSIIDFAQPSDKHRFEVEKLIQKYGIVAVLRPGDILYVPKLWIHFTLSLTKETISVNWFSK